MAQALTPVEPAVKTNVRQTIGFNPSTPSPKTTPLADRAA